MALRPNLNDISYSGAMLRDHRVEVLDDIAFRALLQLVRICASGLVWTYSAPGDGSLPDDDKTLSRASRTHSLRRWRKIRPQLEQFFDIMDGRWHLNEPWIDVSAGSRFAIPLAIRLQVAHREGQRCSYCGAVDVPLAYDHILPVALGGTNEPSNLTLACGPCNASKGAKTLQEWRRG